MEKNHEEFIQRMNEARAKGKKKGKKIVKKYDKENRMIVYVFISGILIFTLFTLLILCANSLWHV